MRTLLAGFAALSFALATPAFASPPEAPAHAEAGHGEPSHAAEAGHAPEGGHAAEGGDHAEGGAHGGHHYYTADDDGDGTPNWRDSDSELFVLSKLGFHLFNLVIYIAILFAFVRQPLLDTLRARALEIRKTLTDSHRHRDTAKERHDEIDARLQALADEIAGMKAEAALDAKAEHARLVARAREEAVRIGETAERNIRDEVARARIELRRDAVELAVQLAESTLRDTVNSDDQKRLAQDFLNTLNDGASADA